MALETEVRSILFLDLAGWSKLRPFQVAHYLEVGFPRVADLVAAKKPTHCNTWGDAIVATFASVRVAAQCALDVRDFFRRASDLDGVPAGLEPRIALHVGEVLVAHNPVLGRADVFGDAVHLAARLEPVTARGAVYCTEAFARSLGEIADLGPAAHPAGRATLPKGFGEVAVYVVTGPGEHPPIPATSPPPSAAAAREAVPGDSAAPSLARSRDELATLFEGRAPGLVSLLREHGAEYVARFESLHRKHLAELRTGNLVGAHEVLRKISVLLQEASPGIDLSLYSRAPRDAAADRDPATAATVRLVRLIHSAAHAASPDEIQDAYARFLTFQAPR